MIMAGGTGGHVFPALAVADYLREKGHQVVWMGTQNRLEARVVPAAGIEFEALSVNGVRGKGGLTMLVAPFMLMKACWQAGRILLKRKPEVVLGMGGFVAGPGGVVAKLLGIPLVLHEQNSVPGTTNRILASIANRVLEAFQGSFAIPIKAEWVGNPLRQSVMDRNMDYQLHQPARILVLGGSLGAKVLNERVPLVLSGLHPKPDVWHQSGEPMVTGVQDHYQSLFVNARVDAFIDDMAEAYLWADWVICRAGAMTISELAAMGLPSILVPYPYAIDDHQACNARYLSDAGAAILMNQDDFTTNDWADELQKLLGDKNKVMVMARAASALAMPDAARRVAEICLQEAA